MDDNKNEKPDFVEIDFSNLGGFSVSRYKTSEGLSEETTAFSAVLLHEGKEVATVTNVGSGGSHDYLFSEIEARDKFSIVALNFYKGEADDALFDELAIRSEMRGTLAREAAGKKRSVVLLLRSKPDYIGTTYVYFDKTDIIYAKSVEDAEQEAEKRNADEYVIYNTVDQTFKARKHTPDAATFARLKEDEEKKAAEGERRRNTWSEPAPLENCSRILVSKNEASDIKLTDSETGRELKIGQHTFIYAERVLIGLFGDAK